MHQLVYCLQTMQNILDSFKLKVILDEEGTIDSKGLINGFELACLT